MKHIFETPNKTKNRFKNKGKKLLRSEIVEMMSTKENKLSKNDLISLWQILNDVSDVTNIDRITLTKDELRQFMNDVSEGLGVWSDTSYKICEFLEINPTDGV